MEAVDLINCDLNLISFDFNFNFD